MPVFVHNKCTKMCSVAQSHHSWPNN